jgi:hypothetical protein
VFERGVRFGFWYWIGIYCFTTTTTTWEGDALGLFFFFSFFLCGCLTVVVMGSERGAVLYLRAFLPYLYSLPIGSNYILCRNKDSHIMKGRAWNRMSWPLWHSLYMYVFPST